MTDLSKAIKFMDYMEMDYDIVDGKMFICAWNINLTETYNFQVAHEEIVYMAEMWDSLKAEDRRIKEATT